MSSFLKRELPHLAILLVMFLLVLYFWNIVPEKSPVHWGIDGEPDRYGGRAEALLVLPLISAGLYFLLLVIPFLDREKFKEKKGRKIYDQVRFLTLAFLLGMQIVSLLQIVNPTFSFLDLFIPLLGVFYIFLGLIIKKAPPNSKFINVPFEINDEESFKKLISYIGNTIIVIGLSTILSAFLLPLYAFILFMGLNILMVVLLFVKSFQLSKEEGNL